MKQERLERLFRIFNERGLKKHMEYVITPQLVQEIIEKTNLGKAREALKKISQAEKAFDLVCSELSEEDNKWYRDILNDLRRSVQSSIE